MCAAGRAVAVSLSTAVALAAAPPLAAQVAVGDSLWRLGRIDEASAAYRKALEEDRNSVRANFRLSQALAWSSNIDSALVLLRAARARAPEDLELLFTEATYLSWGRRWGAALIRYDSITAAHPGNDVNYVRVARARTLSWAGRLAEAERSYRAVLARDSTDRDARFGLAQVRAWSGDLEMAGARYESLLAEDPTEVRLLVALGNLRLWQQRPGSAGALAARALARDSTSAEVRELQKAIRAQVAVRAELSQSFSEDSDRNRNHWQLVSVRTVVADGVRLGASAGFLTATDPARTSRRSMGELSVGVPVARGSVTGVLGVRSLSPDALVPGTPAPAGRSVLTGRLGAQQRIARTVTVGASLARWPFDEVAAIMPIALDIDQWEVTAEWRATPQLGLTAMLGGLDYSDGNERRSWSARASHRLPRGFSVGAFASGFGFDRRAPRYFSPPRFTAGEVTAGWSREGARWSAGLAGGVGAQRIDTASTQSQWHLDGQVARQWDTRWALELNGGRSTSAAASAVGSYAYSTLSLSLRRTF